MVNQLRYGVFIETNKERNVYNNACLMSQISFLLVLSYLRGLYLFRMIAQQRAFKLDGLTGLRFIAAFYVLILHLDIRTPYIFLPNFLQELVRQGRMGVMLFFVLSGFILTYTYQDNINKQHKWHFYKMFLAKRLARIYPAYLVSLVACIILSFIFSYYTEHFYAAVVVDGLMINSYIPKLAMEYFGGGGWSISTEFFFYLSFPLLLPVFRQIKSKLLNYGLLLIFALLSAAPGYLCQFFNETFSPVFVYSFPIFRIAEFICGILTARLVFNFGMNVKPGLALIGVMVATLYLAKFGYHFHSKMVHNQIAVPAVILLIASVARFQDSSAFRWLASKPMIYLGKVSYSFYLVQMPVFLVVESLMKRGNFSDKSYWTTPVIALITLLTAVMLYELVEHPLHARITKRIKARAAKSPLTVVRHEVLSVPDNEGVMEPLKLS